MKYILIYTITKNLTEARKIVKTLIKEGLVACGNIIPGIESIYRWKNKLEHNRESLVFLKTKKNLSKKVIKRVKKLHSYEVPCINILDITDGNKDYFKWVDKETGL